MQPLAVGCTLHCLVAKMASMAIIRMYVFPVASFPARLWYMLLLGLRQLSFPLGYSYMIYLSKMFFLNWIFPLQLMMLEGTSCWKQLRGLLKKYFHLYSCVILYISLLLYTFLTLLFNTLRVFNRFIL